jgi:tetratricopeptide (TPR) repeat protein
VVRRIPYIILCIVVCLALASCLETGKSRIGTAPKPPSELSSRVLPAGIELVWECVPDAHSYTIFWGTERGEYRGIVNSDACSILMQGMEKEKIYYFAVTAWNQAGESMFSNEQVLVYDDNAQNSEKHVTKGNELVQRGQLRDAHAYFSAAILCNPENTTAYRHRAMLYESISRSDLAKQDYATAESLQKKTIALTPVKGASLNKD